MFTIRRLQRQRSGLFFDDDAFAQILSRERMRTDRSGRPLLLVLLELRAPSRRALFEKVLVRVIDSLEVCTRQTDIVGWYKEGSIIGVIFTDVIDSPEVVDLIVAKVKLSLKEDLPGRIRVSACRYPDPGKDPGDDHGSTCRPDARLYPAVRRKSWALFCKRALDVAGSLMLVTLLAPVFVIAAFAVKLTTPGPVFFRQPRIGQRGKPFTFLKFRSMRADADPALHQNYVKEFITAGKATRNGCGSDESLRQNGLYKLHRDPRVTAVGRFLRATSIDELPQLLNVLRGEMSLVGPRPPLAYEVEQYDAWHRRRILEAKPGITGLWQVKGRSRTTFDEMVRLDLSYVDRWSIWSDIAILFQTPRAVLLCRDAR